MTAPLLELDFRRKRHVTSSGVAALAIGLALLTATGILHRQALDESDSQQRALARTKRPGSTAVILPIVPNTEPKVMQSILNRLNFPWDALFAAIEKAGRPDLTLLSIQPEIGKGIVQLRGEARNLYAVLQYVQALGDGGYFTDVGLAEHEISDHNPELPVRFNVTAQWTESERKR